MNMPMLSRKLSETRWHRLESILGALLDKTHFVTIHYSWRPVSPDPADDHIVDCAMNAGAVIITSNVRDFRSAQTSLGLSILTPVEAVLLLTKGTDLP